MLTIFYRSLNKSQSPWRSDWYFATSMTFIEMSSAKLPCTMTRVPFRSCIYVQTAVDERNEWRKRGWKRVCRIKPYLKGIVGLRIYNPLRITGTKGRLLYILCPFFSDRKSSSCNSMATIASSQTESNDYVVASSSIFCNLFLLSRFMCFREINLWNVDRWKRNKEAP